MMTCSEKKETEAVTANVDTISKASTEVYYQQSSWNEAKVKEVQLKDASTAVFIEIVEILPLG